MSAEARYGEHFAAFLKGRPALDDVMLSYISDLIETAREASTFLDRYVDAEIIDGITVPNRAMSLKSRLEYDIATLEARLEKDGL